MGILKKFLYILLPLFLLGNIPRFEIRENVFVNPLDLGMIFFTPIAVYYLTQHPKKVRGNPLSKYIFIFLGALLLSLIANVFFLSTHNMLVASLYFVRLFAYTQLIFVFSLLDKKFCLRYAKLLFFTIGITAGIGLLQYVLYPDLRNLEYLGWDVHLYRIFGVLLDPNFSGVIFALGIAIGVSLLQMLKKGEQKVSVFMHLLLFASLLLTYSRTAILSFLVAGIAFLTRVIQKRYIMVFVIALGMGVMLLPQELKSEGVNLTRTASITSRLTEYRQGLDIFTRHPFFGVGFNAYRAYNPRADSPYPENAAGGIPNSYVFTLTTAGIVGGAALIFLMYGVYRMHKSTKKKYLKSLLLTTSLVVATSALFENTMYYTYILLVYFSVLGIVARLREST